MVGRISAFVELFGGIAILSARSLAGLLRPKWEVRLWIEEAEGIGVRSLIVASITTLFTGMVLALQTAYSLPEPVLTALVVGGRIGAGMTAEIGTMNVTEQVLALRSMAADPVKKLVVPKLAATLLMLPVLTVVGDAMGIFGGLLIAVTQLNVTVGLYWNDVLDALTMGDLFSGLGKSVFFAFFIATIACYNGLTARGGADGVGRATTFTVVVSSITVLISDFFLTKLFYILG